MKLFFTRTLVAASLSVAALSASIASAQHIYIGGPFRRPVYQQHNHYHYPVYGRPAPVYQPVQPVYPAPVYAPVYPVYPAPILVRPIVPVYPAPLYYAPGLNIRIGF